MIVEDMDLENSLHFYLPQIEGDCVLGILGYFQVPNLELPPNLSGLQEQWLCYLN
jgi:hypothetical protein